MQVTEKNAEGLKREYDVVVSAQDIDAKVDARLEALKDEVKLPGFRPGKIPASLLKKRFGKSVLGEVLEAVVNETSQNLLEERSLRPAMQPKIEVTSFDEGQDLVYALSLEIIPDFDVVDFASIELEKPVIEVKEEEIQDTLNRIAEGTKTTKPLKRKRKARKGDVVTIDFDGSVDGEKLPGMAGEDFNLELGSGAFIPGFEDQLVGANVEDDVTVNVTFPEGYGNEKLSGKDAVFEVKVKKIEESVPAEIDDELAEKMGEANLDALKERVKEQIADEYTRAARSVIKRDLLDKLADSHGFDVPEGMIEVEFDAIWQQVEADKAADRLDEEDKGKSDEELKDEYRKIAVRRVRLGLILSDVGDKNNVEVSQDEVNRALIQEAQKYPGQEQAVFEFYQNNPQALASLRAPVFEDKVVDFIIDQAKVSEKATTVEALKKALGVEEEDAQEEEKPKKAKAKKADKKEDAE